MKCTEFFIWEILVICYFINKTTQIFHTFLLAYMQKYPVFKEAIIAW